MVETVSKALEGAESSGGEWPLEQHVAQVTQSAQFMRAETMRKLLLYLWAHREEDLSEYAVATEALGRRSDFDPKTDASVRVQISRLRRKLKDFYETEGAAELYQLQIPMGTHTLTVQERFAPAMVLLPPATEVVVEDARRGPRARVHPLPVILCVLLALLSGWLLWDRQHRAMGRDPAQAATSFWTSFLAGAPVKIILPTPVFFSYSKHPELHVRDVKVNDFASWERSATLKGLEAEGGTPALDHAYTVTSDTLAAVDLARYLDKVGLADRVAFEVTNDGSMNLLEQSSVIAFGAHSTLHPFRDYLASMNFSLAANEAWVENAHPEIGEQARYLRTSQGEGRGVEAAIIAVLPGRAANTKLLIMQSNHTSALVGLLTSKVGDNLFEKMYREHGSPAFFEMVVESDVAGDHILRSWPVAMHAYTKGAPSGVDVTQ
jgi:hypothetical protein